VVGGGGESNRVMAVGERVGVTDVRKQSMSSRELADARYDLITARSYNKYSRLLSVSDLFELNKLVTFKELLKRA
jgi:hypothetical protein